MRRLSFRDPTRAIRLQKLVIITVCMKVANSSGFPQIKGQSGLSYRVIYLCILFCKVIFDYRRLTVTR